MGLFFFVVYLTELDRTLGPTPFDNEILELAADLRSTMLVDVAKMVTASARSRPSRGSSRPCVPLVVRRRYAEALVLVAGLVLVYIAVHVTKDAIARPRPPASWSTPGYAYPSGHAAYAWPGSRRP